MRSKWFAPVLASLGATTFLAAGYLSLADSPRISCCLRLIRWHPGRSEYFLLMDAVPLGVFALALGTSTWMLIARPRSSPLVRGLFLSAGVVGIALIVRSAAGFIDIKGGVPRIGAILGLIGAFLICAAAFALPRDATQTGEYPNGSLLPRLVGSSAIIVGAGAWITALLMPWTLKPIRIGWGLDPRSPYWIWPTILSAAIVIPTLVAGFRMLRSDPPRTAVGLAIAGSLSAMMLFLRPFGYALEFSSHPLSRPISSAAGARLGLSAGGIMLGGAFLHAFLLRHRPSSG